MSNPTLHLASAQDSLKAAYAALNRNDISAMVETFDPRIEWVEPPEFPGGGTRRSLAEVEAHLIKARNTWAEGACEPERFLIAGDKIVVFSHVHVRLKQETQWREGRLAEVYTFRDGKVIQVRVFSDRDEALAWAGAQAAAHREAWP